MSLFELTPQDFQDCEDWVQGIKSENHEFVQSKSEFYSFDFTAGKPGGKGNFCWERTEEVAKRCSTIRMSSMSTLQTLGDIDEGGVEEIPSITEQDFLSLRDSVNNPFALLPERR